MPADALVQLLPGKVLLAKFIMFSALPLFLNGGFWCLYIMCALFEVPSIVILSCRLDEEAQKRADAENNLVAFRKVKHLAH